MSHRFVYIMAAVFIMMAAAACGSEKEGGELPTPIVLPTLAGSENTDPTEALPTEAMTLTPQPTEAVEAEEATPTEETVVVPFALPQGGTPGGSVNNTSSVPPFIGGTGNSNPFSQVSWRVASLEPVAVYSCPETTCEELGKLEPNEDVDVTETGEEWLTIVFEEQTGFVGVEFVRPAGQTGGFPGGNAGLPPNVNPADMTSGAPTGGFPGGSGQIQPPSNPGLPPGVVPAIATATSFFPPAQTQSAQQGG